jgi:hypothetical protein
MKKSSGPRSTIIALTGGREIKVYAGKKIREALDALGQLMRACESAR